MMNDDLNWYIDNVIKHELEQLVESKFTGNIEFKVNMKDGGIANCNCSLNRSVKKI